MNTPLTAAFFSAAIFPGAGHFWLKRWLPGSVIAAVACYALYLLIVVIIAVTQEVATKLESGAIPLSISKIHDALLNGIAAGEHGSVSLPLWLLLAVWVVGILDAYRVGYYHDKHQQQASS